MTPVPVLIEKEPSTVDYLSAPPQASEMREKGSATIRKGEKGGFKNDLSGPPTQKERGGLSLKKRDKEPFSPAPKGDGRVGGKARRAAPQPMERIRERDREEMKVLNGAP